MDTDLPDLPTSTAPLENPTRLLAYIIPQDRTKPVTHGRQLVTTPEQKESLLHHDKLSYSLSCEIKAKAYISHVIFSKNPLHCHPEGLMCIPSDSHLKRPEKSDKEAWNRRITIGDSEYHMLSTYSRDTVDPGKNPSSSKNLVLLGDVFILKVARQEYNFESSQMSYTYTDVDHDPELLSGQLELKVTQQLTREGVRYPVRVDNAAEMTGPRKKLHNIFSKHRIP